MPLRTAYKKCPDCIFLSVDFNTYIEVNDKKRAHDIKVERSQ